jgi:AraC family transcriptional regulator
MRRGSLSLAAGDQDRRVMAPRATGARDVGGLIVSEYLVSGPTTLASHAHPRASLSLLLHGGYRVDAGDGALDVRAPMVVFFPAKVRRRVTFPSGVNLFLWIDLPDALTMRLGLLRPSPHGCVPVSSGRPEWLAHRILAELRARDAASALLIEGRVLELLGNLARTAGGPAAEPEWLPVALRAIHDHVGRIPLGRLARVCRLHPAHLSRAFRQHMGCSVGEYSRQSRVSRARILLRESALTLADIATECGFADQAHFSRVFKKMVGSTPLRFRRGLSPR